MKIECYEKKKEEGSEKLGKEGWRNKGRRFQEIRKRVRWNKERRVGEIKKKGLDKLRKKVWINKVRRFG